MSYFTQAEEEEIVKSIRREEAQALRMSTTHCRHDQKRGQCAYCERAEIAGKMQAELQDVEAMIEEVAYPSLAMDVLQEWWGEIMCDFGELDHP